MRAPCCETRSLTRSLSDQRPGSYRFGGRRIDFRDLEKAIGLGIVRPGDEGSAHFCTVPAGYDAKPKRLFCLNVTRRKILHGVRCLQVGDRSRIERRSGFCRNRAARAFLRSGRIGTEAAAVVLTCFVYANRGPPRIPCGAGFRWKTLYSLVRRVRVVALRIGEADRADGNHLHRYTTLHCRWHHDHGGNAAIRGERQSLDHLLIGDDLVCAGRQQPIDALDPERMSEGDDFPPRARGHAAPPSANRPAPTRLLCMSLPCALLIRLATAFSQDSPASSRIALALSCI